MIYFCRNPECGRGFVDVSRKPGKEQLCATCRRHIAPLSRLVGGRPRAEAEARQIEKEKGQV